MSRRVDRVTTGKVLIGIAVLGLVASVLGVVGGWRLVTELDTALNRSLALTEEALVALESSVEVAEGVLVVLDDGLTSTEATTRELSRALEEGEVLFEATADITENEIASALEAVEESLPALIDVAGVIDATLSALSSLPIGLTYNPDEPFDQSLREVRNELRGIPDDLRDVSELVRDAGANLEAVREGTADIADDLGELQVALSDSADLLAGYTDTAAEARTLISDSRDSLVSQLRMARVLIVMIGLAMAGGQLVPFGAGWLLLNPGWVRDLLVVPPPE